MNEMQALPRLVPVSGARNFRDLGGYQAACGRRVRQGAVLRGGHPGELTEEGRAQLADLGLGAIVDLRTNEERAGIPYPEEVVSGLTYWSRDYSLSTGDFVNMMLDPATTPEAMRHFMFDVYRRLFVEQTEGIGALLRLLLEGSGPVLVNCTAGKDRTGIACAVVLAALGVPRDTIRADYAFTETVQDPDKQLFHVDPAGPFAHLLRIDRQIWRIMMRSDPEYLDVMFAALNEQFGETANYLREAHGLSAGDITQLRGNLLEG